MDLPFKFIRLPKDKWLVLMLLLSSAFQAPEIIEFISRYINFTWFYTYFLKSIPILLLWFLCLDNYKVIIQKKFIWPFIFAFFYSLFEFNGIHDLNKLLASAPSFFSIFALIFLTYYFGTKNNIQFCFIWIARVILLYIGFLVLAINILDGKFSLNFYLYLGLLISIPASFFLNFVFFLTSFFWSIYSENRTLAVIVLFNLLIYILNGKILRNGKLLLLFIFLLVIISNIFIITEGNKWFTDSILSGRAGIWSYWLDILNHNIGYSLLGVGLRSEDYTFFTSIGNSINSINYFGQFHSGFIATLVRGGWLLVFINLLYINYLLKKSKFDIYSIYITYSIIIFVTFNMSFDYLYPNIFGLMLVFFMIRDQHKKGPFLS